MSHVLRASRWVGLGLLLATLAPLHHPTGAALAVADSTTTSEPCASMSTAYGSALSLMTAGVAHTFAITARDSAGLAIQGRSGATFVARLSQMQISRTAVIPDSDDSSLFEASVWTSAGGPDVLSIRLAQCGGLWASYYGDTWFGTEIASGVDPLLVTNASSLDSWVHESFLGSVKWSGYVRPPVSGEYTFSAAARGAAHVSLRGQTVLDLPLYSSGAQGDKIVRGTIQVRHALSISLFTNGPLLPRQPWTAMAPRDCASVLASGERFSP